MKLIRVFTKQTSFTPTDELAFVGEPPKNCPDADYVHISVTFTWDKEKGEHLSKLWGKYYPVNIGGPAYSSPIDNFIPGMYVKHGVTFTSRGCLYNCKYCLVPKREGKILEYADFAPGYIIQDNNILACSHSHQEQVYAMIKLQKRAAIFSGGLSAHLVDDWVVSQFKQLRIREAFFACDTDEHLPALNNARKLLPFLNRNKLRCYVLLGFNGESLADGIKRLKTVWDIGFIPFAQLYQPPDTKITYEQEWRQTARAWARPAIIKSIMKKN